MSRRKHNNARARLAIWSSVASLALGWSLTIWGFVVEPTGQVHDSVLWILGQALIYAGAVIGIAEHYKGELGRFKSDVRDKLGLDEEEDNDND